MTRIAQTFADRIILTADNPRKENLKNIIQDMQAGLDDSNPAQVFVELDRKKAIVLALTELNDNDLLLIAGKGHETYQDIDGLKIPYSDEATLVSLGYQDIAQQASQALPENLTKGAL
jgi:UDP-N-acetylmuramoyl-L-alanyl-D-glutamate--2,6-diaminopimelate ligase